MSDKHLETSLARGHNYSGGTQDSSWMGVWEGQPRVSVGPTAPHPFSKGCVVKHLGIPPAAQWHCQWLLLSEFLPQLSLWINTLGLATNNSSGSQSPALSTLHLVHTSHRSTFPHHKWRTSSTHQCCQSSEPAPKHSQKQLVNFTTKSSNHRILPWCHHRSSLKISKFYRCCWHFQPVYSVSLYMIITSLDWLGSTSSTSSRHRKSVQL